MEDQVIVNVEKEESKSSVAINPRYPNSDKERFKQVLNDLLGLLLIFSFFTAYMKILSFDSELGMQISKFSMNFSTLIFLGYQLVIGRMIMNHPVNNTIYSILYMLQLSSVISVAEGSDL
ncbi:hypothetical protein P8452_56022 [Trifolium repens]|nr:hypothetical protein P8452_56022 [Trifolium repens]